MAANEIKFWDSGFPSGGVDTGVANGGELKFWDSGFPFVTVFAPTNAPQTISPTGIASAEAFGSPTLTAGAVTISPTGIASAEAFGTPTLTTGAVTVSPTGIASEEAFGTPTLTTGAVTVSPTGIASEEAFGTPTVTTDATILSPTGIASAEAFGTATLTTGAVIVSPTGIPSEEAFGSPIIVTDSYLLLPVGIPSEETFGNATITTGVVVVSPTGIPSEEAFGTASLGVTVFIFPTGIPSEEAFGTPDVTSGGAPSGQTISPSGIPSEEAFGLPFIRGGTVTESLKKKIKDAIVMAARLGTFIEVTYDSENQTLTQGLQVAPATIEANEISVGYKVDDAFGRRFKQDYQRWSWLLILRFQQEVIAEPFERALLDKPICIKRALGEDRQVHVLLVDAQYTHPPREGPSNGTEARYRLQAELSRS